MFCGYEDSVDFFFFFFKQKTAYEMRISDWSSDVCSSDLDPRRDRCCGSTARSAGRTPGVPRVDRLGPEAICGAAPGIEFWHICHADENRTCCAQPCGNGSVFRRYEFLKQQ